MKRFSITVCEICSVARQLNVKIVDGTTGEVFTANTFYDLHYPNKVNTIYDTINNLVDGAIHFYPVTLTNLRRYVKIVGYIRDILDENDHLAKRSPHYAELRWYAPTGTPQHDFYILIDH
jgi:hypothetical protein